MKPIRFAYWFTALAVLSAPAFAAPLPASPTPDLSRYRQECASCHVAYPPALLPAPSWQRLMDHLPQHFGTDASLDPDTVQRLSTWLQTHAAMGRAPEPPQDRITRSAWFVRRHDEVPAAAWQRPAVKRPANCAACHPGADQGDFDEHRIRIPR
jgi:hypothetical protein